MRPTLLVSLLGLAACAAPPVPGIHPFPLSSGRQLVIGAEAPPDPDSVLTLAEAPNHYFIDHYCDPSDTLWPTRLYRSSGANGATSAIVTVDAHRRIVSYQLRYPDSTDFGDLVQWATGLFGKSATTRGFIWPRRDVTVEASYGGAAARPPTTLFVYSRAYYNRCVRAV